MVQNQEEDRRHGQFALHPANKGLNQIIRGRDNNRYLKDSVFCRFCGIPGWF